MRFVLNVFWLVFGGLFIALGYALAGVICCILIVTIPFGIASFRMANYALWPFGRELVRKPTAGVASTIGQNFSAAQSQAAFSVAWTNSIGPGRRSEI